MYSTSIILASQSPRRKQLLQWAEVPFDVIVQETDEAYPPGLAVDEVAVYIAKNKALAVKEFLKGSENENKIILAADTIVVIDNEVIGKPKDQEDAIAILKKLNGRVHQVVTGVILLSPQKQVSFADITEVEFHELTHDQIAFYVDKYKPYDKAGAYAIQEWIGVVGIRSVKGDFYNVMGLPVSRVMQALENF